MPRLGSADVYPQHFLGIAGRLRSRCRCRPLGVVGGFGRIRSVWWRDRDRRNVTRSSLPNARTSQTASRYRYRRRPPCRAA